MKKWNLEPSEVESRIQTTWQGNWLVLRCSNQNTLPLVAAMTDIGVQAWTPMWIRQRRYPRSQRSRKVLLPCLPSFAFIPEKDTGLAIRALDCHGVPGFSIMNSYGVIVRIKDKDLDSLRKVADLDPRKKNPVKWPAVGSQQKIISGAFQGLVGEVKGHSHRHCLVAIDNAAFPIVKIPPFLLSDIEA